MKRYTKRTLVALTLPLALAAALSGCEKESESEAEAEAGPDPEALLAECTDAVKKLDAKEVEFQDGMSKMMATCGEACDAGAGQVACDEAKRGIDALCNVMQDACAEMCGTFDSDTLNDLTCNFEPDAADPDAGAAADAPADAAPPADDVDPVARCAEIQTQLQAKEVKFAEVMSELMTTCSVGCDRGDQASCEEATKSIGVFCDVSPDVCKELCGTMQSDTANKFLCNPPTLPE